MSTTVNYQNAKLKWFHVFSDRNGYNVIFNLDHHPDDLVYGYGSNYWYKLGLGHTDPVETPVLIDDLCNRNIHKLLVEDYYTVAIGGPDGQDYSVVLMWGRFDRILHPGFEPTDDDFIKRPRVLEFPFKVQKISLAIQHALILSTTGKIYAIGTNQHGQLGSASIANNENNNHIKMHMLVKVDIPEPIMDIYCCDWSSYALTRTGRVYSWGRNYNYHLGHQHSDDVYIPKLIDGLANIQIQSIRLADRKAHFLTTRGQLYYCGELSTTVANGADHTFQIQPILLDNLPPGKILAIENLSTYYHKVDTNTILIVIN
ncbi:probable E3 ubiquitin-protein ligase HERC4 [Oppia nitens]|uniref:probable E3 ubiquitin-protein ligase HERC4 n=1 Tax=Oppia nitens TaxID=1686743 RepID=UPI0023DB0E03|nr:probable E3 ubiquitin-protein ligase HERC4 [Oppia nitens]